jgi:tRNA (guanosine-2'-O-)-methyltransferase
MAGLRIVLDRLEDGGNRAAILRSCEAFGLLHVHEISTHCPASEQADSGRLRRHYQVGNGGEKWLQLHRHADAASCAAALRAEGFALVATVPPPQQDCSASWHTAARPEDAAAAGAAAEALGRLRTSKIEELDFGAPTALVLGSERLGVSPELAALCDRATTIPLFGLTESLNVSVAAGARWALQPSCKTRILLSTPVLKSQ